MPFQPTSYLRHDYVSCKRCELAEKRSLMVLGEGHPEPWILFIGEGPGAEENKIGRPFHGRSGQLLTQLLAPFTCNDEVRRLYKLGARPEVIRMALYEYEGVYITNSVICGSGYDTPNKKQLRTCKARLYHEIYQTDPYLIVTLGASAAEAIVGKKIAITSEHGKPMPVDIIGVFGTIRYTVVPTYHPSYLLKMNDFHNPSGIWQSTMKDLGLAFHLLDQIRSIYEGIPLPQRGIS